MNWTVELDRKISRRLTVHLIRDPDGNLRAQHQWMPHVLEWLQNHDVSQVVMQHGEHHWYVTIEPQPW